MNWFCCYKQSYHILYKLESAPLLGRHINGHPLISQYKHSQTIQAKPPGALLSALRRGVYRTCAHSYTCQVKLSIDQPARQLHAASSSRVMVEVSVCVTRIEGDRGCTPTLLCCLHQGQIWTGAQYAEPRQDVLSTANACAGKTLLQARRARQPLLAGPACQCGPPAPCCAGGPPSACCTSLGWRISMKHHTGPSSATTQVSTTIRPPEGRGCGEQAAGP